MKRHWYRIHVQTCPICGHEEIDRERVYGVKPTDYSETHSFADRACDDHFL